MGCYGASLAILAGVGCNVRVNPLNERVQSSFETCIESVAGAPQRNLWRRKWEEMILVLVEVVKNTNIVMAGFNKITLY